MILAIDTATDACSIALVDDNELLEERHEVIGRGHAERLVPMIAEIVPDRGVHTILVDCGPGSFTGLRVGIATARALGLGWGAEVYGYSSLALMAAMAFADSGTPDRLAVTIEGGHGEMFVQRFKKTPFTELAPMASLTPDAAIAQIEEAMLIGNAAAELVTLAGTGEAVDIRPRAANITQLPKGFQSLPARPIYGRPADAKPLQ